jgi:hypothetical protein
MSSARLRHLVLHVRPAHNIRCLCSSSGEYFGPGGLSARQIFEKVQEGRVKDAQRSTNTQETQHTNMLELDGLSSKQLRDLLVKHGISVEGIFERDEMLRCARDHLK